MDKKPYVMLFISIVSVSFAAVFIVSVSESVSPLSISFYRLLFTFLLVSPAVVLSKNFREELKGLSQREFLVMVGIGVVLALHFALWVTSLDYTSVASSVILVTAHPVLVAPVAHYFLRERLSLMNLFGIGLSIFGVVVLVLGNYDLGPLTIDSLQGNILAILGGVAAGLYILGGRKMRKTVSISSYVFVVYATGAVALFFMCLFFNSSFFNLSLRDYEIIFLMAIVSGVFGHTLYNWSLAEIRASVASVALLWEPIGSTLLAYVIPWIHQTPSFYTIIGGFFILLGIYLTCYKHV
ncbi:MAG: EamA/RhaT family transporter [Thermoplasmata archaeon]|nr:MAG: EamA/RhaT family transporter [Thermoplasmata archaeon]RLF36431.1 MAG: EamA/RhaT family transporter [Thermoplasmata archaeon]